MGATLFFSWLLCVWAQEISVEATVFNRRIELPQPSQRLPPSVIALRLPTYFNPTETIPTMGIKPSISEFPQKYYTIPVMLSSPPQSSFLIPQILYFGL